MALAPPIDATGQQQRIDILGDVRLVHGTGVSYFGPFAFSVRLPEG